MNRISVETSEVINVAHRLPSVGVTPQPLRCQQHVLEESLVRRNRQRHVQIHGGKDRAVREDRSHRRTRSDSYGSAHEGYSVLIGPFGLSLHLPAWWPDSRSVPPLVQRTPWSAVQTHPLPLNRLPSAASESLPGLALPATPRTERPRPRAPIAHPSGRCR